MPPKKNEKPLTGVALVKETCRRIRVARSYLDTHNNRACRGERAKALALYESLTEAERAKVPQVLRVWLRYRSEKYFGGGPHTSGRWSEIARTPRALSLIRSLPGRSKSGSACLPAGFVRSSRQIGHTLGTLGDA